MAHPVGLGCLKLDLKLGAGEISAKGIRVQFGGWIINDFTDNGIELYGFAGRTLVEPNYIGTDATGTEARGNE